MKNKLFLKILALLAVISLIVIILLNVSQKKFKTVTLSENNLVLYNDPKYGMYDTILKIALDIENIKNVTVSILPLGSKSKGAFDGELAAKVTLHEGVYYLFISDLSESELIKVISHEVIHIKQYESKKIIFDKESGLVIWEGNFLDLNAIPYDNRPWEIEAFSQQNELSSNVEQVIY